MMKFTYLTLLIITFTVAVSAKKQVYDTIIYTHYLHETKYEVGKCDVCHENIKTSKKARDDNYADDQSCQTSGCHDIKNQDSCFVCHTNADAKTPPKPKREIKNNHKIHEENKIDCKVCHTYIDKHTYFTRREMPRMVVCIDCHTKEKINNDCEYCHSDITITMSHEGESRGWHGDLYNHSQQSCNWCHTNSHCNNCHQGLASWEAHPINYRYTHKFDVFSSETNCVSCHANSYSCDECHMSGKSWGKKVDHEKHIYSNTSCKACHVSK